MGDDAEVVRAVLTGRAERYAELVDRHAPAVFRLVRAAVPQHADADDLAQETFLAAYRGLERLRDPGRFRFWLLSIAARKTADFVRLRTRRQPPLPLRTDVPARESGAPTRLEAVEAVVEEMPELQRLVFALRHHEGLSCKQIAAVLGTKEGTVYSRLSRMHAAIRRAVGEAKQ